MKKRKAAVIAVIVFLAVLLFALHTLLLGSNEKYDFIPYIIGSLTAFSIIGVVHYEREPID